MSLNDTVRAVEASIPGCKVLNAKHFANPAAVQAAERGTAKFKDRAKRTADEEFGGQKYRPGSVRVSVPEGQVWWLSIGVGEDKPREYGIHGYDRAKTLYRTVPKSAWIKHECAECAKPVYQDPGHSERETWLCDKCRYRMGLLYENESGSKWRKQHKSMTLSHLGGMEITNENIGGIMGAHGAPEVSEALRAAGVLQVRRDQNGNPVQTAVFSGRKDMAEKIKLFNRMQRDAQARGFKGTREGVEYLRHGGLTPD